MDEMISALTKRVARPSQAKECFSRAKRHAHRRGEEVLFKTFICLAQNPSLRLSARFSLAWRERENSIPPGTARALACRFPRPRGKHEHTGRFGTQKHRTLMARPANPRRVCSQS